MGFSISWIAIKNRETNLILQELGLCRTGILGESLEFPIMGRQLNSGWYLITVDGWEYKLVESKKLSSLSLGCQVIGCLVEEHTLFSSCEMWVCGNLLWRVEHNSEKGIQHLNVFGSLPENYPSIASFYFQQQEVIGKKESVDMIFDIPLQLANNIVGFKHDEYDSDIEYFEKLLIFPIKKL